MTKEEAIEELKGLKYDAYYDEEKEALDMAIEALKQEPITKNDLALINTEGLDEGIRCAMCTNSMANDRGCDGSCVVNKDMYKAVMDAIEKRIQPTTKNDLGVDCISRQAVNGYIDYILSHGMGKKKSFDFIKKFVTKLPSVTPREPIIDKIRAEIEELKSKIRKEHNYGADAVYGSHVIHGINAVLEIFDKYNAESEDKEWK